ncbi:L,D-transpeptidase family protein [Psychrobacter sp. I-STPA6b]|uniref:L,D-transpeptidase family protein n=1 Tax=Psychrobacter sp. I-STPA6b TaxID=2585718 RepID=UPI001D0C92A9|nr:L,D-transpeptidase family protein [Psychrobacter sp. I-STPA6b]
MKAKYMVCAISSILSITLLSACNQSGQTSLNAGLDTNLDDITQQSAEQLADTEVSETEDVNEKGQSEDALPEDSQLLAEDEDGIQDDEQQDDDGSSIEARLAKAVPDIDYSVENLTLDALKVNITSWYGQKELNRNVIIKIQALLNWHQHGVGAVDGAFGGNVIKAMQAFQKANNLPQTNEMNVDTWLKLVEDTELANRPVLVNYTLTKDDVYLPRLGKGVQYRSVKEALAEKFHMSQGLLSALNTDKRFKAGETITIYNRGTPNMKAVDKVVVDKKQNILYAYDDSDNLVATYPTTVGGRYTPSPNGNYKVINRVLNPTYNSNFRNKNSAIPPGPNNPVGRVWLGLNKQGFGIHGSPEPEKISQQNSHGCVRLTNWDALALYSTINEGAAVEFL